jgi:hypothetical protein
MRFPIIFSRNIIILISLLLGIIRADVTVVGSLHPSTSPDFYDGTTYRPVAGYINQTTDVKITVTLTGDDAAGGSADKSTSIVQAFAGFNSSANVSIINVNLEGHGITGRETSSECLYDTCRFICRSSCSIIARQSDGYFYVCSLINITSYRAICCTIIKIWGSGWMQGSYNCHISADDS